MLHFVSISFSLTFTLRDRSHFARNNPSQMYHFVNFTFTSVSFNSQYLCPPETATNLRLWHQTIEGESKVCIFTHWSTCSLDHHQNLIYQFLSQGKCVLQLSDMLVCFWDILLTDRLRLENWTWLRLQWRTFAHDLSNNVLEGCSWFCSTSYLKEQFSSPGTRRDEVGQLQWNKWPI